MIPVGNQRKKKKKKECISKNGIPADGGILFFEMSTPKQWRKHSQANMPSNYTKKLEQVFTNKSKNSKNVKISLMKYAGKWLGAQSLCGGQLPSLTG
jgi:hypothetical protein